MNHKYCFFNCIFMHIFKYHIQNNFDFVFLLVELMRLVGDGNTFSESFHDDRSAVYALTGM